MVGAGATTSVLLEDAAVWVLEDAPIGLEGATTWSAARAIGLEGATTGLEDEAGPAWPRDTAGPTRPRAGDAATRL